MKVKYSDIEDGHHYVSFDGGGETMAVVQKSTGRVLLYSDDLADDDWPSEEELETDDYAFIPDKFDLEIGRDVVFDFVSEQMPEEYDRVAGFFTHRGAYGNFKDLAAAKGLLDAWHTFENRALEGALRAWCEEEGIELAD